MFSSTEMSHQSFRPHLSTPAENTKIGVTSRRQHLEQQASLESSHNQSKQTRKQGGSKAEADAQLLDPTKLSSELSTR